MEVGLHLLELHARSLSLQRRLLGPRGDLLALRGSLLGRQLRERLHLLAYLFGALLGLGAQPLHLRQQGASALIELQHAVHALRDPLAATGKRRACGVRIGAESFEIEHRR